LKLAIVSSNSTENIKAILGPSSIHFDMYKCGSSLFGKPKKFEMILKETGLLPHEVLCIGDEIRDIEAARSVRAHAGSVSWGYANSHALREANPDYLFNSMEDILSVI
jgi:phosphoglycolate phosphatase